ncbi:MAG: hypothetical protein JNM17_03220, partial [Archangium sp.]|nr:hypothetical protein [Archangium sp.]
MFLVTRRTLVAALGVLLLTACPEPVTVGEIGYFRGKPLDIKPGESVSLSWQASNAAACLITPDVGEVATTGSTLVNPMFTTTYELQCNGAKQKLVIVVRPPPSIDTFTASSTDVFPDAP